MPKKGLDELCQRRGLHEVKDAVECPTNHVSFGWRIVAGYQVFQAGLDVALRKFCKINQASCRRTTGLNIADLVIPSLHPPVDDGSG